MIDSKIQADLRARFNPEGSMLRKQQLRMLEILSYIDKVCKDNNITYWLSSGTLLGAVRHGGFIPWDDDLDIEMLLEDYEKFIRVFPQNNKYVLQTHKTDSNFFQTYAKVRDIHSEISELAFDKFYKYRGLFVDVFCIERIPRCICRFYSRIFEVIVRLRNKCGEIQIVWWMIKGFQKIMLWSIHILRPVFKKCTRELHHSYGSPFLKKRNIEDLFPLREINFEGSFFPAPNNYDNYLREIYGDYHQIPPTETITFHSLTCIFKE